MIKRLTFTLSALCFCTQLFCQLPSLDEDASISKGILPNGISYYLAMNPAQKGMLSISLVQRMDAGTAVSELTDIGRGRFGAVRFGDTGFETFLCRNGVLPDSRGYVYPARGSLEYRFLNFSAARGEQMLDSLLIGIFRLAASDVGGVQYDREQTLIVCGDFDKGQMVAKMGMASVLCPKVDGVVQPSSDTLATDNQDDGKVVIAEGEPSKVIVKWYEPRVAPEQMKTVLPLVARKLAGEMSYVLKNRLYPVFREEKIPVFIDVSYMGSEDTLSDVCISLEVYCARPFCEPVAALLKRELDRLYAFGVDDDEYHCASEIYRHDWQASTADVLNQAANPAIVQRCKSNFLYGASLADERSKFKFVYRDLPDSVLSRMFNNYMQHVLSAGCAVDSTLTPAAKSPSLDAIASGIRVACGSLKPVKAPKKDEVEILTEGVKWVFPGGINVIYKKMETDGMSYYSYSSRGGRQWADPDYFNCLDGVSEEMFKTYLYSRGIRLNADFLPLDVRLSGQAPSEHLEDVMQLLVALSVQPENKKVFSPECHKLFVLVGDRDVKEIKTLLSKYVASLGPGVEWFAGEPMETAPMRSTPDFPLIRDVRFSLDYSVGEYATSEMARLAFRDAFGEAFTGCGVRFVHVQNYVGFPSWHYQILFGVRRAPLEGFAPDEEYISPEEASRRLNNILPKLATTTFSAEKVDAYRQITEDAFISYSRTPDYYVNFLVNRYMDIRNLSSGFVGALRAQDGESLHRFFYKAAYH